MSEQESKNTSNLVATFRRAVTSEPVKTHAPHIGIFGALSLALLSAPLAANNYIDTLDNTGLNNAISLYTQLPPLKNGECHFINTSEKRNVNILEYPNGVVIGGLKRSSPSLDDSVTHRIGTLPSIKQTSCDVLKNEFRLTQDQAKKILADSRKTLLGSPELAKARDAMQNPKGFVRIETAPSAKR